MAEPGTRTRRSRRAYSASPDRRCLALVPGVQTQESAKVSGEDAKSRTKAAPDPATATTTAYQAPVAAHFPPDAPRRSEEATERSRGPPKHTGGAPRARPPALRWRPMSTPTDLPGRAALGLTGPELFFLAGPCVLEEEQKTLDIAGAIRDQMASRGLPFVFKASFDKANRSSLGGGRGPGMEVGLGWLARVKADLGVPVVTDVHHPEQCAAVAEVADVLQIPAFLCRQTDLLVAAARTGRVINVKKGQFLSPWDMGNVAGKVTGSGNPEVLLTERGTTFGYGRLVVDMTGLRDMAETGHPVVFDATHSVQRPGALGDRTGGDRSLVPLLARAAVATGAVSGLFIETHPDPDTSPSDGPNMVPLAELGALLDELQRVHAAVR